MNKILSHAAVAIVAVALTLLIAPSSPSLSGTTHFSGPIDSAGGFSVSDTTVIDSSGNVDGSITSDTGTFSSTLTVSGETNVDTLVQGGNVLSLTNTATGTHHGTTTLTAAQVCNSSVISLSSATTTYVYLPSTTTLAADCLSSRGDHKVFLYENANTAATSTQIFAGAGITLISDDSSGDIVGQNGWAEVEITNVRASEFTAVIRPFTDAD